MTASSTRFARKNLVALMCCVTACGSPALHVAHPSTPTVDSTTAAVNGTRLFYEAAGRGSVVVLLHAGNLDRRQWDPQFLALAQNHRVIRYDARGYGRSGRADTPFRADEDLYALLLALHVSRASLVGSSLGGRVAIDFALAHPSMVDRLVLAAPGLSGWQFARGDTSSFAEGRVARARGDSAGIAIAWLKQDFMRPAMERPELAAHLREMAGGNGRFWMDVLRQRGEADRQGDPPALHRTRLIPAPTLLVVGSRDTPDIMAIADTLGASMPHLRRVSFEGAGHMVNLEQADRFTKLVLDFLDPDRPER
ncbi:MAG: alpha/beta fold hydrolase [Gemmatimonadaceae bacterium]